ncbi:hypothetical protein O181_010749 [Austropuccinia psidii MF-1]|uniref:Uncharacterized protein n=1 Tax=Austropuccinia psidii MF-1 TaxID=1389203 RepID=A0A9Q3BT95_9BASI|nr:hypothetical protein [Austropuccinia psidii MF-1]
MLKEAYETEAGFAPVAPEYEHSASIFAAVHKPNPKQVREAAEISTLRILFERNFDKIRGPSTRPAASGKHSSFITCINVKIYPARFPLLIHGFPAAFEPQPFQN